MDDILTTQFDHVEQAVHALVESIAAYNPSPQAALDLVAADDELSRGLDLLAQHQANHARIQALHAQADALEEQLKSSVATLASLRHELFETPATTFPADSRPVRLDELLQFATTISDFTVPPTFRERVPEVDANKDKEKEDGSGVALTNGASTPANIPDAVEPPKDATEGQKEGEKTDGAVPEITAEEEEWLKKLKDSNLAWYPWPDNDKIRRGNLYKLQYYREKNFDLDALDIWAHEEALRSQGMGVPTEAIEPQNQALEPSVEPAQEQPVAQAAPRVQSPPGPPKPTFDMFDDLDDE
ncbi:mediator of RNA polymerase II transcription subunit 4 [Dothidotthia symphoricarpi CBS 119687]|uniref:Mediator of RNA polymerase II transcription subunit 4 n=1 Tax=Dothidotthia symphoricarpi CBS 119687 TaxID=1392245 RepID=A0A6A6AUG2_9PLEO|nr:mediator of RNA polymerase II transcription subunit 4 [Dothidotthia symphoricarpi CBS 119687]KAF2134605.1 mediator of RNA polymerase II transcription subunit 4 [Dothidotthia symphoricarpi CBS 119687]